VGGYFISLSRKGLSMATLHRRRASIAEFARWGLRKRLWIDDPMADTQKIARPRSLPKPYTPEERARLWRSISRATRRCCAACSTGAARA
jgi:site-specific recombinase XerD